jgi:hypothetical protein
MEANYSNAIKLLGTQYYNRELSVGEYRRKRRDLINQMDREFNGDNSTLQNLEGSEDASTNPYSSL